MYYYCYSLFSRAYAWMKKAYCDYASSFLSQAQIVYQDDERIVYKLHYVFEGNEYTHVWSKEFSANEEGGDQDQQMLEEEGIGSISAAIFKCEDEMIDAYPVFKYIQGPLCPLEITPMEVLQFLIDKRYLRNSNYLDQDWLKYGSLVVYYKNLKKRTFKMTESLLNV